jgi:uncharacterized protein YciI
MTYAVTIDYGPDIAKIEEFRPSHRDYLRELISKDKLVISGPFVDNSAGLIVYNAENEAEVEAIIKADPFYKCGVFQTWKIRAWKIVMANRELLP